MKKNKFYSKVLLFGEYSIMLDSMALSLPYDLFSGFLTFSSSTRTTNYDESKSELKAFSKYIKDLQESGNALFNFDRTSFEFDIEQGLYFKSTIPVGYGIGSSGALCAALYDRYGVSRNDSKKDKDISNYLKLKKIFAQMESHFHGSSSGIDPLISYANESILMENREKLGPVTLPDYSSGKGALFLLNTGRPRRTEPLVNLFLEKLKNDDFKSFCHNKLIPTTNECIVSFLEGNIPTLVSSFQMLSEYQYEHFSPMIPKLFVKLWKKGLNTSDYFLKLCGAGGGGVFLGITKDFEKAKSSLENSQVRVFFKF